MNRIFTSFFVSKNIFSFGYNYIGISSFDLNITIIEYFKNERICQTYISSNELYLIGLTFSGKILIYRFNNGKYENYYKYSLKKAYFHERGSFHFNEKTMKIHYVPEYIDSFGEIFYKIVTIDVNNKTFEDLIIKKEFADNIIKINDENIRVRKNNVFILSKIDEDGKIKTKKDISKIFLYDEGADIIHYDKQFELIYFIGFGCLCIFQCIDNSIKKIYNLNKKHIFSYLNLDINSNKLYIFENDLTLSLVEINLENYNRKIIKKDLPISGIFAYRSYLLGDRKLLITNNNKLLIIENI
jgi:hypothetical protein